MEAGETRPKCESWSTRSLWFRYTADRAGFAAAFASSLAAARLVPAIDRLPYTPIAVYRIALGLVVAARSSSMES